MTDPQTTPSRRDFLKTTGLVAAASASGRRGRPAGSRRRGQHDPGRPGRLRRPRHRRRGERPVDQERPDQAGRHGRRLRGQARRQLRAARQGRSLRARVDVARGAKFIGFDAYRKAMDCLKPGDVVILATPPAFRWVHFAYAIEKGLQRLHGEAGHRGRPDHAEDARAGREGDKKNLKVGVGLMCRHCKAAAGTVRPDQGRPDRRHRPAAGLPPDRPGRLGASCRPSPTTSASCSTRSGSSTASCGPAAAATATS